MKHFLLVLFSLTLFIEALTLKTVFDYVKKKPPNPSDFDYLKPDEIITGKIHLFNKDTGEYEGYVDDSDLDVTQEFTDEEVAEIIKENDFKPLIGISEREILRKA